jgi:hypothetical protein
MVRDTGELQGLAHLVSGKEPLFHFAERLTGFPAKRNGRRSVSPPLPLAGEGERRGCGLLHPAFTSRTPP